MIEVLANMTLGQLLGSAAGILFLLGLCIEITPIKVNPISAVLKWLGKKMNGDVVAQVQDLGKEVVSLRNDYEEQVAVSNRYRILRFGDEILHGVRHSQDHFEQILRDIDAYERYCDGHKTFKNNVTAATTETILSTYKRCRDENDFL